MGEQLDSVLGRFKANMKSAPLCDLLQQRQLYQHLDVFGRAPLLALYLLGLECRGKKRQVVAGKYCHK